jgi:hypothetical protein
MLLCLEPRRAALQKRLFCEIFLRRGYFVLKFAIKVNFVKMDESWLMNTNSDLRHENGDVEECDAAVHVDGTESRGLMMAGGHACWLTEDDAVEMADPEQIHSSRPSCSVKSPSSSASLCAMHGRLCFCSLV